MMANHSLLQKFWIARITTTAPGTRERVQMLTEAKRELAQAATDAETKRRLVRRAPAQSE